LTKGHWHAVGDGEVVAWAWTRAPRSGRRRSGRIAVKMMSWCGEDKWLVENTLPKDADLTFF
jgi:hypothetical protein